MRHWPLRLFLKFNYKKGRSFLLLPFFIFMTYCAVDLKMSHGRITLHNTGDKNSFIFLVDDEFIDANKNSPQDEYNPRMTVAESKLLLLLLREKKYCLNDAGNPIFTITSRQEKIFDVTFAHLIAENYRANPIAPRMYFGQCILR